MLNRRIPIRILNADSLSPTLHDVVLKCVYDMLDKTALVTHTAQPFKERVEVIHVIHSHYAKKSILFTKYLIEFYLH